MQKTYILPEELKKELRKIWGVGIFGKKKKVNEKFKKFLNILLYESKSYKIKK